MKDTNRAGNIHKDETAEYHELNFPKIISVKPIDIPVINVSNQNPDFVFKLGVTSQTIMEGKST